MNQSQETYSRFMLRVRRHSNPYSFKNYWMGKIRSLKRKHFIVKNYNELTKNIQQNNENCSVCFEEFQENSKIHQTVCNHFFCVPCIEKWTDRDNYTCPLCRGDL